MNKRALVATRFPLEFDRDTGSQRLLSFIDYLREDGWAVNFVSQVSVTDARYSRHLQQQGIPVYVGAGEQVAELIRWSDINVALILYWEAAEVYIPIIRALSPATRIIVDTVDLNFLRNARRTFLRQKGEGTSALLDTDYAADVVRELNSYNAADALLAVSEKEAELIGDLLADSGSTFQVPLSQDLPLSPIPFDDRKGMLFAGNFRHPPNTAAVEFLCRSILPKLDSDITAQHPVYIVGNGMNELVRSFGEGIDNVHMIGWVPDLAPYLDRVRVALVPLLYGAGVKGKLIQPLMAGTPVVTTSVGAEGLDVRDGEHVLIADEATAFADRIGRLLKDRDLWERLSQSGREQMVRLHGREVVRNRFIRIVNGVLEQEPKGPVLPTPDELRAEGRSPLAAQRIREIVGIMLPSAACLALFDAPGSDSFGLGARAKWSLWPGQGETGAFAHPDDQLLLIQHLEGIRADGAEYLLVPANATWLLERSVGFRKHLDSFYPCIWSDENCSIYELERQGGNTAH